jgi:large subunit ribosomal protein L5
VAEENREEKKEERVDAGEPEQVGGAAMADRPEGPVRAGEQAESGKSEEAVGAGEAARGNKAEQPVGAAEPAESGKAAKAEKPKKEKKAKAAAKGEKPKKEKKAKEFEESPPMPPGYSPRLLIHFRKEVGPAMQKRFGYSNTHQIPRLAKIVVNMGVGEGMKEAKLLDAAVEDLATITGQRPKVTKARKSVASFKVRKGMSLGCKVTLRGMRMYEFFDRLVTAAIPRIRDFRGLSPDSFDGHGNYTFGIKEQIVFPEIDYDKVAKILGMDITIATTCKTDEEALELLKGLGMPFRSR